MIDMNKKYRTIDGREVRIYATDGEGDWNVHGALHHQAGWSVMSWTKDGRRSRIETDKTDLVEIVEPKTVWINLDEDGCISVQESEQDALMWRSDDHLHTYKVELTEADIVELGNE